MSLESQIIHNLRLGTDEGKDMAMRGLELAERTSMGVNTITFHVGVELRNGKRLPERKESIELVISPNWDRARIKLVDEIYEAWVQKKVDVPTYWNVVKYQPFLPSVVYDLDLDGVTHNDFEYCIQFNYSGADVWVGILIFVKEELAKSILEKVGDGKESDSWVLNTKKKNGRAPLIFLNAAVGEYNMIMRIKAVEFLPANSHSTIPRYALCDLHAEFEKIDKYKYASNSVNECVRCGHYSYQTNLVKCEGTKCDIYYCDAVCKEADAANHVYICKPSAHARLDPLDL